MKSDSKKKSSRSVDLGMIEDEAQIIYVYRYIWLNKGDDSKMCIKVLSGVKAEQEEFMHALKNNINVKCASRVYLHEYNVNLIEMHEILVEENKDNGGIL